MLSWLNELSDVRQKSSHTHSVHTARALVRFYFLVHPIKVIPVQYLFQQSGILQASDDVDVFSDALTSARLHIFSLIRRYLLKMILFTRLSVPQFIFGHIHFLTSPKVQSFLQHFQSLQYYDLCWLLAIRCYYSFLLCFHRWRDLPEYHPFLSLRIFAIFTIHSSVQLSGFSLYCDLTSVLSLIWFLFVRPEICLNLPLTYD